MAAPITTARRGASGLYKAPGSWVSERNALMRPGTPSSVAVDHVIGAFPREGLSAALASTHRAGFGPQTRVFDGERGDVMLQLDRAGLEIRGDVARPADALLIVVTAPGRAPLVAELFEQLGAASVLFAARRGAASPASTARASEQPDIRIGDDAGTAAEA